MQDKIPKSSAKILTYSGAYFDLLDPWGSVFDIRDIAHALANICRFTGHTYRFYSVAQHSVLVSQNLDDPDRNLPLLRGALLHDAAEAYLGDVSTPLKALLPEYRCIEQDVGLALDRHFGMQLWHTDRQTIKRADLRLLATEKRDLMPRDGSHWEILDGVEPLTECILPLPPRHAEELFLDRARELGLL